MQYHKEKYSIPQLNSIIEQNSFYQIKYDGYHQDAEMLLLYATDAEM